MPADNVQSWALKLHTLLQEAAAAKQAEDLQRMAQSQRALRRFTEDSPDFADALDRQAIAAMFDLDMSATQQAVEAIRARAQEVFALTKLIQGVSAEAAADASVLGGRFAVEAIDAASNAISSFRRLRDQLQQPAGGGDKEMQIAAEIERAIAAISALRGRLETA